ncbi:uncharacterized protein AMSG_02145 [Thecamonas trahens ATCC 50062]|uniref:BRCT domain-containing protein n=1 Tax=Thecamonas trahens ATCC 50062 TaxID=461836 RepID=A0A0L0DV12_THETB|nr:hypothetical protein AMSG_02145 [Thecamonas trahens ATCC 50062]KNC56129.1 hypothetical protein AMSG_02145 [Thecamonas trahens ATCC 50062]|eukprot:XP_013761169.1 hypothetical protein AMSG_02145 [Thecamonas trahens ATCC 50062]
MSASAPYTVAFVSPPDAGPWPASGLPHTPWLPPADLGAGHGPGLLVLALARPALLTDVIVRNYNTPFVEIMVVHDGDAPASAVLAADGIDRASLWTVAARPVLPIKQLLPPDPPHSSLPSPPPLPLPPPPAPGVLATKVWSFGSGALAAGLLDTPISHLVVRITALRPRRMGLARIDICVRTPPPSDRARARGAAGGLLRLGSLLDAPPQPPSLPKADVDAALKDMLRPLGKSQLSFDTPAAAASIHRAPFAGDPSLKASPLEGLIPLHKRMSSLKPPPSSSSFDEWQADTAAIKAAAAKAAKIARAKARRAVAAASTFEFIPNSAAATNTNRRAPSAVATPRESVIVNDRSPAASSPAPSAAAPPNPPSRKRKRTPPPPTTLAHITFTISGIANPERATLRSLAAAMGATYSAAWSAACNLLIAAPGFDHAAKVKAARAAGKPVVGPDWLHDSYAAHAPAPLPSTASAPAAPAAAPATTSASGSTEEIADYNADTDDNDDGIADAGDACAASSASSSLAPLRRASSSAIAAGVHVVVVAKEALPLPESRSPGTGPTYVTPAWVQQCADAAQLLPPPS